MPGTAGGQLPPGRAGAQPPGGRSARRKAVEANGTGPDAAANDSDIKPRCQRKATSSTSVAASTIQ
eukprot:6667837-Alexandrium_andersonii.AAC.1